MLFVEALYIDCKYPCFTINELLDRNYQDFIIKDATLVKSISKWTRMYVVKFQQSPFTTIWLRLYPYWKKLALACLDDVESEMSNLWDVVASSMDNEFLDQELLSRFEVSLEIFDIVKDDMKSCLDLQMKLSLIEGDISFQLIFPFEVQSLVSGLV